MDELGSLIVPYLLTAALGALHYWLYLRYREEMRRIEDRHEEAIRQSELRLQELASQAHEATFRIMHDAAKDAERNGGDKCSMDIKTHEAQSGH